MRIKVTEVLKLAIPRDFVMIFFLTGTAGAKFLSSITYKSFQSIVFESSNFAGMLPKTELCIF